MSSEVQSQEMNPGLACGFFLPVVILIFIPINEFLSGSIFLL